MEKIVRENLLLLANRYRRATGKSLTAISKEMYGDAYFFVRIKRESKNIGVRRLEEMLNKFRAEYKANDIPWPALRVITMGSRPQA